MTKLKNIQSAVQQNGCHSRPNISQSMLTTAKIGQIFPIYHEALVPGDKVHVNTSMFCRFAPLAVPAYVRLNLRTMTLFVPYHQLADGCESFFDNQKKFRGHFNHIPVITMNTLSEWLLTYATAVTGSTTADLKTLSLSGSGSSQTMVNGYYNLTPFGKYALKVLRGLGYNIGQEIMGATNSAPALNFKMNALPLLAWCHGYNSYMSYSPTQNNSALSQTLEEIKRKSSAAGYELTTTDLTRLMSDILLTYDDSMFTLAWANPYGNQGSVADQFFDTSVSVPGAQPVGLSTTQGAYSDLSDNENLTASQMRLIMAFDDYFRRSNYGGSKDIEQIYSQFGVKIDDFRTRYPYFLRESTQPVSIGDVTSTSDTAADVEGEQQGSVLGSYAGKAIGDGNTSFDFECHDYGMLITYAWFAPDVKYYQGFDKECLRTEPFDFYTPQLDKGFADTIKREEFRGTDAYMRAAIPSSDHEYSTTAYASSQGNVPLYCQYLFGRNYITGDFRMFKAFETWHFGRDVTHKEFLPQSSQLIYMPNIGTEYERIFHVADPTLVDADTIYLDVYNDVNAYRPMKDFTGKVGLGDGDLDIGLNGSQVN